MLALMLLFFADFAAFSNFRAEGSEVLATTGAEGSKTTFEGTSNVGSFTDGAEGTVAATDGAEGSVTVASTASKMPLSTTCSASRTRAEAEASVMVRVLMFPPWGIFLSSPFRVMRRYPKEIYWFPPIFLKGKWGETNKIWLLYST